ncbi:hypothetical protein H7C18_10075 [Cohnella sp. CBP 2801]|uniref:SGNH hydrolase-type esterase domain-containing protein n=1 Tax=Cohnella zeiphila TaxID=2761120 RepID=A0A7X0SP55_9BACL|nr:hypothetical protein [Cohnella zeiphila]
MNAFFPRAGLPNVFAKLAGGGDATIVYLGGSITRAPGYRVMTAEWLQEQYPQAKIEAINAGVSGTGSDLGAARTARDVLRHRPDLVFVEFVVNDRGAPESKAWIEGIVRQVRNADPMTDLLFVYTLAEQDVAGFRKGRYQPGALLQDEVADEYGIPSIHLGVELSRLVAEGTVVFTVWEGEKAPAGAVVFTRDSVHPTVPDGHRLYADEIVRRLKTLRGRAESGMPSPHLLPAETLVPGNPWEYAAMKAPAELAAFAGEWTFETPERPGPAQEFSWLFPGLWRSGKPGDAFTVEFVGTHIGLFDIGGPYSGRLKVSVDGGEPIVLDRFTLHNDHDRNEYAFLPALPNGRHVVRFEIDAARTDKAAVFEAAGKHESLGHFRQHPDRYGQTLVQLGMLLLVQPPL